MDTSVAVPAVLRGHPQHAAVQAFLLGRWPRLTGHSLAETYSLLTRLPGAGGPVAPDVAAAALSSQFDDPVLLSGALARRLPAVLAEVGVRGGAVYDALVGLAALEADLPLVTRDGRALATYAALGVRVELVPSS